VYEEAKNRVVSLRRYVNEEKPPHMDCSDEQQCGDQLEEARNELLQRNPRLFGYLLRNRSLAYTRHVASFDTLYRQLTSGQCPCGQPLASHQVLFSSYVSVSKSLDDQIEYFLEGQVSQPLA